MAIEFEGVILSERSESKDPYSCKKFSLAAWRSNPSPRLLAVIGVPRLLGRRGDLVARDDTQKTRRHE
jgi:hypothetical protein